MKILFTSLSILLIFLSCIPCSDTQECNAKVVTRISSSGEHQRHNHTEEDCSPFCTCACCAASTFSVHMVKTIALPTTPVSLIYPLVHTPVYAGAHYSIWQPPKNA